MPENVKRSVRFGVWTTKLNKIFAKKLTVRVQFAFFKAKESKAHWTTIATIVHVSKNTL